MDRNNYLSQITQRNHVSNEGYVIMPQIQPSFNQGDLSFRAQEEIADNVENVYPNDSITSFEKRTTDTTDPIREIMLVPRPKTEPQIQPVHYFREHIERIKNSDPVMVNINETREIVFSKSREEHLSQKSDQSVLPYVVPDPSGKEFQQNNPETEKAVRNSDHSMTARYELLLPPQAPELLMPTQPPTIVPPPPAGKLVINKISVEVVHPDSSVVKQKERIIRVVTQAPTRDRYEGNKLSFGLGQL